MGIAEIIVYGMLVIIIISSAFILNLPMLLEIEQDYLDYKKQLPDNKKIDVYVRAGGILSLSLLVAIFRVNVWAHSESYWVSYVVCVLAATGWYISLFNYLMNYVLGRKWYYLSPTSKIDMFFHDLGMTKYKLLGWHIIIFLISTVGFLVI